MTFTLIIVFDYVGIYVILSETEFHIFYGGR